MKTFEEYRNDAATYAVKKITDPSLPSFHQTGFFVYMPQYYAEYLQEHAPESMIADLSPRQIEKNLADIITLDRGLSESDGHPEIGAAMLLYRNERWIKKNLSFLNHNREYMNDAYRNFTKRAKKNQPDKDVGWVDFYNEIGFFKDAKGKKKPIVVKNNKAIVSQSSDMIRNILMVTVGPEIAARQKHYGHAEHIDIKSIFGLQQKMVFSMYEKTMVSKMIRDNHRWHNGHRNHIMHEIIEGDENIRWSPILSQPYAVPGTGFEIQEMSNGVQLKLLAADVNNCVDSFAPRCLTEDVHVFSISENGKTQGVFSIKPETNGKWIFTESPKTKTGDDGIQPALDGAALEAVTAFKDSVVTKGSSAESEKIHKNEALIAEQESVKKSFFDNIFSKPQEQEPLPIIRSVDLELHKGENRTLADKEGVWKMSLCFSYEGEKGIQNRKRVMRAYRDYFPDFFVRKIKKKGPDGLTTYHPEQFLKDLGVWEDIEKISGLKPVPQPEIKNQTLDKLSQQIGNNGAKGDLRSQVENMLRNRNKKKGK